MAESLQSVVQAQYNVFKDALENKLYREVDLQLNIMARGASMVALYNNAALSNDSANMTLCLTELEEIYQADINPPSLILSGIEAEAARAQHVAVTGGVPNVITFPISLSSTGYSLFVEAYDSNGDWLSRKWYSKTVTGFTIEVADNGFIDYSAILV